VRPTDSRLSDFHGAYAFREPRFPRWAAGGAQQCSHMSAKAFPVKVHQFKVAGYRGQTGGRSERILFRIDARWHNPIQPSSDILGPFAKGEAVYGVGAFPDDDLLWRIEWGGGVGHTTTVPSDPLIDICRTQICRWRDKPARLLSAGSSAKCSEALMGRTDYPKNNLPSSSMIRARPSVPNARNDR
jgi:hypothetical protein